MYLFSLHVLRSCDHFYILCILLSIYMMMYVFQLISHVLFLFSLYTHVSSFIQLVYVSHLMP